jgi:haloalkane dehalogenase
MMTSSTLTASHKIPEHLAREFPFQSRFIEIAGVPVHYIDEGEGPTILLLPPGIGTVFYFKPLIENLRGKYRLIAVDFPGFGFSELPQGWSESPQAYADFVVNFVKALGLQDVALLVNDTSGPIGLQAAAMIPENFNRLIVSGTAAFPYTGRLAFAKIILGLVALNPIARAIHHRFRLLPWVICKRSSLTDREKELFLWFFRTPESRARGLKLMACFSQNPAFMKRLESDLMQRLRHKPTLLLFGQADPVRFLGAPGRFRKLFANYSYTLLSHSAHFPALELPTEAALAIDQFLEKH